MVTTIVDCTSQKSTSTSTSTFVICKGLYPYYRRCKGKEIRNNVAKSPWDKKGDAIGPEGLNTRLVYLSFQQDVSSTQDTHHNGSFIKPELNGLKTLSYT